MKSRFCSLLLASCVLIVAAVLSGCADNMVAPEQVQSPPKARLSKFRHADLTPRAVRGMGKSSSTVGLVISLQGVDDVEIELEKQRLLERYKLMERYDFNAVFKGLAVEVESSRLDSLAGALNNEKSVRWFEPDIYINSMLPLASDLMGESVQLVPWNVEHIGATVSSAVSGDGLSSVDEVAVFLIDTGVSHSDIDVKARLDLATRTWVTGTDDDTDGHGTHIAGTLGAIDDLDGIAGVAPGVDLYSINVVDANGAIEMSTVVTAVEEVTRYKQAHPELPMVVNISLGADVDTTGYNALDEAIEASIAAGVVYVISAGNSGIDASTVTPAHVAGAITVGAYNRNNSFASFSNYGSIVDLLAPGVDVESLAIASDEHLLSAVAPTLKLMSGTSMAAGHVTGAAALYLSQHPGATPQEVRDALVNNGRDWVTGMPAGTTARSVYVGDF